MHVHRAFCVLVRPSGETDPTEGSPQSERADAIRCSMVQRFDFVARLLGC
jgi:hypothetical protein